MRREAFQGKTEEYEPQKVTAVDIDDFLAREIPRRRMLLRFVIPEQGLVMVVGPRGVAKTWLMLSMGYTVAVGGDLLRFLNPSPCRSAATARSACSCATT
jgi:AAA domain-containing protein